MRAGTPRLSSARRPAPPLSPQKPQRGHAANCPACLCPLLPSGPRAGSGVFPKSKINRGRYACRNGLRFCSARIHRRNHRRAGYLCGPGQRTDPGSRRTGECRRREPRVENAQTAACEAVEVVRAVGQGGLQASAPGIRAARKPRGRWPVAAETLAAHLAIRLENLMYRVERSNRGNSGAGLPDWGRWDSNPRRILTQSEKRLAVAAIANSAALHRRCILGAPIGSVRRRLTLIY